MVLLGERPSGYKVEVDYHDHLTPRQMEVLGLLAKGLKFGEIAALLGIKLFTVNTHVGVIRNVFHATSKEHAVFNAVRKGLLDLDTLVAGLPVENASHLTEVHQRVLAHTIDPQRFIPVYVHDTYVRTSYDKLIYPILKLPVNNRTHAGLVYMAALRRGILQPLT